MLLLRLQLRARLVEVVRRRTGAEVVVVVVELQPWQVRVGAWVLELERMERVAHPQQPPQRRQWQ